MLPLFQIKKTRADIERCWIKYCVNLLKDSVQESQDSDISEKPSKLSEMRKNFEEEEEKEKDEEGEKEETKAVVANSEEIDVGVHDRLLSLVLRPSLECITEKV